ncbi:MAG: pilus assembly protein [Bdellovibrionales bacterium CG10_big_fil_rev_8_21_14_0_10_45_34]|nr:MAG: pilus assembly protein [Bdellovibrionales bacterium CG10_big_fil_rev_8_21_14_0_10_45_34]
MLAKILRVCLAFFFSLLLLGLLTPGAYASDGESGTEPEVVYLTQGFEEVINVPDLPTKPKFEGEFKKVTNVSYSSDNHQLKFVPKNIGSGTLTIKNLRGEKIKEYVITVRKSNLNRVAREVSTLLREIEGITVKIINNKVIVDGEVLLPRDLNRIHSVVSQYADMASNIVRMSPHARKKIAEFIERDINNPEIHVRSVNDTFILEGVSNSEDEKKRAEIIAKTYVPDPVTTSAPGVRNIARAPVVNLISVRSAPAAGPKKIIQLVVHYVELKKDYTRGFRFQWTPDVTDNSEVQFSNKNDNILSTITGTISNLLPKLNWAKQHGHARVLQSTSIIVENGTKGLINSVTAVPFQTINQIGSPSTSFQEVGIKSDITPNLVSENSDSVSLQISFELSGLMGITDQGPLLSRNNIQTSVTVRSGMSAAIGGLVQNSSGTDYNKLPQNVSANPIISLYTSKSFRKDQSQFVVFVTPIIKSSASSGSDEIKKKFRLRY